VAGASAHPGQAAVAGQGLRVAAVAAAAAADRQEEDNKKYHSKRSCAPLPERQ